MKRYSTCSIYGDNSRRTYTITIGLNRSTTRLVDWRCQKEQRGAGMARGKEETGEWEKSRINGSKQREQVESKGRSGGTHDTSQHIHVRAYLLAAISRAAGRLR
jgi:hypothetical protein